VRVGAALIPFFGAEDSALMERIAGFRKQFALDFGLVIPRVRIKDDRKLAGQHYEIWIQGLRSGDGELLTTRELAIHAGADRARIDGIETRDPSYGLPAVWIEPEARAAARSAGYMLVDAGTVFVTHVSEAVKRNAHMLVTRQETERMVGRLRQANPGLVEELVPNVLTLGDVQRVLQNLLREKVPVRNLELILEVLSDAGRQTKDAEMLTEAVRERLGPVICQSLAVQGKDLQVLTLDPAVEQTMAGGLRRTEQQTSLVLEPRFAEQVLSRLAAQVEKMVKSNIMPVLLCAPELRRHLRKSTERVLPHLAVVSMAEIPASMSLTSFGTVAL